jgi:predicted membrane protein
MLSIAIRSRIGNVVLIALGVTYAVAGAALLFWSASAFWGTVSSFETKIYLVLLAAIAFGIVTATVGLQNLGIGFRRRIPVQTALSH